MLAEALSGTGLAGSPERYFSDHVMRTLAGRWGTRGWGAYTVRLIEATSSPSGVFGALVTHDDLARLLDGLGSMEGCADRAPGTLLESTFPGVRFVWVGRRDSLRQAVSWERAVQTKVWADTGEPVPIAAPRPRFDRAAIAERLRLLAEYETAWRGFFEAVGAEPVRVDYEDLASDYEGSARRVLEELGVSLPRELWFGPRRLRRQADARTERWVRRFTSGATNSAHRPATRPTGTAPPIDR